MTDVLKRPFERIGWGVMWRSDNELDGSSRHLCGDGNGPVVFKTRSEAREWAKKTYGYIKDRPDLQAEPHGWKTAKVVRVRSTVDLA